MDDLENFPEETDATENDVKTIEIKTTNPQKVKLLKLIVALLEAEQYEAAYREIEKLKTIWYKGKIKLLYILKNETYFINGYDW